MRGTANYQLPLWDAADRILREDFNRGNEKTDAALIALQMKAEQDTELLREAIPYIKLGDVTTKAAANVVSLDLRSIDFTQYTFVQLYVGCPLLGKSLFLRVNGIAAGYTYMSIGGSGGSSSMTRNFLFDARAREGCPATFNIHFDQVVAGSRVSGACFSANDTSYNSSTAAAPCKWGELNSFDLCATEEISLPAKTRMVLYGIR